MSRESSQDGQRNQQQQQLRDRMAYVAGIMRDEAAAEKKREAVQEGDIPQLQLIHPIQDSAVPSESSMEEIVRARNLSPGPSMRTTFGVGPDRGGGNERKHDVTTAATLTASRSSAIMIRADGSNVNLTIHSDGAEYGAGSNAAPGTNDAAVPAAAVVAAAAVASAMASSTSTNTNTDGTSTSASDVRVQSTSSSTTTTSTAAIDPASALTAAKVDLNNLTAPSNQTSVAEDQSAHAQVGAADINNERTGAKDHAIPRAAPKPTLSSFHRFVWLLVFLVLVPLIPPLVVYLRYATTLPAPTPSLIGLTSTVDLSEPAVNIGNIPALDTNAFKSFNDDEFRKIIDENTAKIQFAHSALVKYIGTHSYDTEYSACAEELERVVEIREEYSTVLQIQGRKTAKQRNSFAKKVITIVDGARSELTKNVDAIQTCCQQLPPLSPLPLILWTYTDRAIWRRLTTAPCESAASFTYKQMTILSTATAAVIDLISLVLDDLNSHEAQLRNAARLVSHAFKTVVAKADVEGDSEVGKAMLLVEIRAKRPLLRLEIKHLRGVIEQVSGLLEWLNGILSADGTGENGLTEEAGLKMAAARSRDMFITAVDCARKVGLLVESDRLDKFPKHSSKA